MIKSFSLYGSLLFKIKNNKTTFLSQTPTDDNIHNTSNQNNPEKDLLKKLRNVFLKMHFVFKIFFSVFIHIPEMLFKRYMIKKLIADQKTVDSWVDYVDNSLKK